MRLETERTAQHHSRWRASLASKRDGWSISRTPKNIDYAGSLAGWSSGVHEINGKRVLVRDSPVLINPEPGGLADIEGESLTTCWMTNRSTFWAG